VKLTLAGMEENRVKKGINKFNKENPFHVVTKFMIKVGPGTSSAGWAGNMSKLTRY
jgi:hypothetical protein